MSVNNARAVVIPVTNGGDTQAGSVDEPVEPIAGSLRAAVATAQDGDIIEVAASVGTITLIDLLEIRRSITIKGNGNVITATGQRALFILFDNPTTATTADPAKVITIERVHFKDIAADVASIFNRIDLTLKACIFSGNSGTYGALLSQFSADAEERGYPAALSLYGCTFINNANTIPNAGTTAFQAMCVETSPAIASLTLAGNIFNGTYNFDVEEGITIASAYNVTGDDYEMEYYLTAATDSLLTNSLVSAETFAPLVETLPTLPDPLPAGYPTVDFYGAAIAPGSVVGAVVIAPLASWALTGTSPNLTLTISDTRAMVDYAAGGAPWYADRAAIKTLNIESGVASIGDYAFYGCSSLTSVSIPSTVTSIGSGAFSNCSGLTAVTIPSGVTSIEQSAFAGCSSLTSVSIPSTVTRIGDYAFAGCSGLTSIACLAATPPAAGDNAFAGLPANATLIVPCAGVYMLAVGWCDIANIVSTASDCPAPECLSFTSGALAVQLCPATGTLTVTGSGAMADYNTTPWYPYRSRITSVVIEEGVTSIGDYAFYECSELTAVSIPDGVTSIGIGAFYGCSGLTAVSIPSGVTSIGDYAFYSCRGLTAVTIPSGVTSIGDSAFEGCSGLTSVTNLCPVPQTINVSMFYGVDKETCTLYVPVGSVAAYQAAAGWKDFLVQAVGGGEPEPEPEPSAVGSNSIRPLQLYPNPTTGLVYVDNPAGAEVEVYTLGGVLVGIYKGAAINIAHLPAGAYIIKVGSKSAKVVKQ
jgi:hypothetical protein